MRFWPRILAFLLFSPLFLQATRAWAQSAPSQSSRVAVLLVGVSGSNEAVIEALNEVLIGAVASHGNFEIIGKEEFQSMLGQGDERSIDCVTSAACLGRVGVQLRVEQVIAGTVAFRDGTWTLNLNRTIVDTGEVVGRLYREIQGGDIDLASALQAGVPTLFAEAPSFGTLIITASEVGARVVLDDVELGIYDGAEIRRENVSPGAHTVEVHAEGFFPWVRHFELQPRSTLHLDAGLLSSRSPTVTRSISPWFFVAGSVALAAAGTATYFAVESQREIDLDEASSREEAIRFYDDRDQDALVANVCFGVAGAAAGAAIFALFFDGNSDSESEEDDARPPVRASFDGLKFEATW